MGLLGAGAFCPEKLVRTMQLTQSGAVTRAFWLGLCHHTELCGKKKMERDIP